MQKTLLVNGTDCKTIAIDGLWSVIINDVPHKLYRVWRKNKGFKNGRRKELRLKAICVNCFKEFFGPLGYPRRFCSQSCSSKNNKDNLHTKFIVNDIDSNIKIKARNFINNAIRDGKIIKPEVCSNCGCHGDIQAHHPDSKKKSEVIWWCLSCHMKFHYGHEIKGKLVVYNI